MKTTLLIMAAGLGSRFGEGIKQLAKVDQSNHIIMDYSIHDAIAAGFNKIVFIIRKDIETDFREIIGNRIEKVCEGLDVEVDYAYQDLENIPDTLPLGRTKPWGTGQAVLAAKEMIDSAFAVINADDYYGKTAFVQLHKYLSELHNENEFCMAGFVLKNTLSENGSVTRGVCQVDENNYLISIEETSDIIRTMNGAATKGQEVDAESYVSMNMWGLSAAFLNTLEKKFEEFFQVDVNENPMKAEFLLPIIIGELLSESKVSVKVLETPDKWFGVTYAEDKALVEKSVEQLIKAGVYKSDLYSDL